MGDIFGHVNGNIKGDVKGNIYGSVNGNVEGLVYGKIVGQVNGIYRSAGQLSFSFIPQINFLLNLNSMNLTLSNRMADFNYYPNFRSNQPVSVPNKHNVSQGKWFFI